MITPFLFALAILVVLFMIILLNTVRHRSGAESIPAANLIQIEKDAVVGRLSESIRVCTLSSQDPEQFDQSTFLQFHSFLKNAFPAIHRQMELEIINDYSLLYKWEGSDDSLKPLLFIAHFDVVPVEPGTEQNWTYDAFSGKVADGYIWGRGAIDMKSVLISQMEAAESLIKEGYKPERTIYFAYGHDEEIGGGEGAAKIGELLKQRDVELACTIDEGMMILDEDISWTKKPLAIIAIAEKGYVTLRLTVTYDGGHSSIPPEKTTLGILCHAVGKLERNQRKATISGVAGLFFKSILPDLPWKKKILFANSWLFKPLLINQLKKDNVANAMIRTTLAPTIINGGVKENILPTKAYALVNFRLLPGDSIADVIRYAKKIVNDPNIDIIEHSDIGTEASPVSDVDSKEHLAIQTSIQQVFPGTRVTPGLEMGGTDSKHYLDITDNSYRFSPIVFGPGDVERVHGTDERIGVEDYVRMVQFYGQVIRNVD